MLKCVALLGIDPDGEMWLEGGLYLINLSSELARKSPFDTPCRATQDDFRLINAS